MLVNGFNKILGPDIDCSIKDDSDVAEEATKPYFSLI